MPNRIGDFRRTPAADQSQCGIIRVTALCDLCRYRHNGHWTGHENRLARQMGGRFGSEGYAMEELVAELSSAILGAELGLPVDHLDHHASYLASWLKVLKADSRAILTVAAKAEAAASLLLQFGRREVDGGSAEDALAEPPEAIAA